ncbi:EamA family transporter [Paracoccus benzoatiresistens]|uniref:EamA family transporter n=1 Tax=Paracoccus benzoatiresistens TaxID=2997341 RepID=A0ABT4JAY6_9RHOB|nr:EamA family transporter [Paracoccus sp. EF6]MCZ0963762.1 EamA family transporter [Paracoccus sp. EF6]
MARVADLALTAVAPAVWGTTYLVTTEWLPDGYPLTLAALRALPAGLLLLLVTRHFPPRDWIGRVFVLGTLNFSIFWGLLFVAAYRLPGGAAATIGALQPLMVMVFARGLLGQGLRPMAVTAALAGAAGVALMLVGPDTAYDPLGVAAAAVATVSMSAGTVLSRKWQPQVPVLAFTAWQLTAGGLVLSLLAVLFEPPLPELTLSHVAGLAWLVLIGAALTYGLWLRGIARLEPQTVSLLGMLSPVVAVVLGWQVLGEALGPVQVLGAVAVLMSIWIGQRVSRPKGA